MRFFLGFLVYAMTIGFLLIVGGGVWAFHEFTKPGPAHMAPAFFTAERGMGAQSIAQQLHAQGLINHPLIFTAALAITGQQNQLKAGEYEIASGLSMKQIMDQIVRGDTFRRQITIPEGLTSFEIVAIIKSVPALSGDVASLPAEGSLLPQTYDYQKDEARSAIIERMKGAMTKEYDTLCQKYNCTQRSDFILKSKNDIMTLASLVEKETGIASERARIAGVFLNRLKAGIPLQTDPSVIYALTQGKPENKGQGPLGRRLLLKDLEIDSPYNTYRYAGLPPGPIANPGAAAIEAVLNPEQHDLLYFVADGSGGHVFAKTLEEHNKNVAQWRKIRKTLTQTKSGAGSPASEPKAD
ncbi:MAG: endolytic transglycosylase MltG [Alphaproteobacteria bacterium]|nr:endolytic transglycosylase MltG [Alphaproteobacteria bacterium]